MTDTARYISTPDCWGHIFDEKVGEIMTQWVYDTEREELVGALVASNRSLNNCTWNRATDCELGDLEDSIKNANPEALEKPNDWGLIATDEIPEAFSEFVPETPKP